MMSLEESVRDEAGAEFIALTASLVAMAGSIAVTVMLCLGGVLGIASDEGPVGPWLFAYLAAFAATAVALVVQGSLPDLFVRSAGLLFVSALLALPTLAAAWVFFVVLSFGFGSVAGVVRGIAALTLVLIPVTCVIIASAQLTIFTERTRREQTIAMAVIVGCSALVIAAAVVALGMIPSR